MLAHLIWRVHKTIKDLNHTIDSFPVDTQLCSARKPSVICRTFPPADVTLLPECDGDILAEWFGITVASILWRWITKTELEKAVDDRRGRRLCWCLRIWVPLLVNNNNDGGRNRSAFLMGRIGAWAGKHLSISHQSGLPREKCIIDGMVMTSIEGAAQHIKIVGRSQTREKWQLTQFNFTHLGRWEWRCISLLHSLCDSANGLPLVHYGWWWNKCGLTTTYNNCLQGPNPRPNQI